LRPADCAIPLHQHNNSRISNALQISISDFSPKLTRRQQPSANKYWAQIVEPPPSAANRDKP
jgi:hypothetical protein